MSGYVVEILSSAAGHRSSAWLTEFEGIACVASDQRDAKVFPTFKEAEEAALRLHFHSPRPNRKLGGPSEMIHGWCF